MSETDATDRTSKDYAIEFGGYLAKAADEFLKHPKDWEYARALRLAVYEFRKRAERAKGALEND